MLLFYELSTTNSILMKRAANLLDIYYIIFKYILEDAHFSLNMNLPKHP